ncbi:ATP-dependent Clp protease ATP-binding subunit ClpA [Nonomuraea angiospora]|uniref:ATP-dependent Clp protease ATP-binding subunit ClpA n=1 Tax=Nonomuraea angiospora TaxID=46172 RepID=A0ABR9LW51_9ACTN|nr:ATP-dependent Clp protease ATP-binding subunit ClpA [Nonomuraea angiospora]
MFERFTDRARRVVVLAQEEARTMSHNYIGTEHILLGLIHEGEGLASLVLDGCGVELEHVRAFVEREVGHGAKSPSGHIPFTPRAKKVLELSLREALQLRHNYIGTEHILLGLIREGEGLAAQALVDAGADLADVRQRLLDRVGRGSKERPTEMFFAGGSVLGERLTRIEESLERIERHLGIQPQADQRPDEPPREEGLG